MCAETPSAYNPEAEQAILGALLGDPAACAEWIPRLRREDFYPKSHQLVFSAIVELHRAGHAVDLVTVTDRLRETEKLDAAGGTSYVTGLLEASFSSAMIASHIAILRRDADRRALATLGLRLHHASQNGADPEALAAEAHDVLDSLEQRAAGAEAISLEQLLADNTPPPAPLVENLIFPQSITLLAGQTKIGKTQLALQLARAATSGQRFIGLRVPVVTSVLYIGQEDARWALRERLRGIESRFAPPQGALHLVSGKGLLLEGPDVRRLVKEHRPGLLVLDPLRRFHTREEEKGEMAQVIRQVDLLIRDYGCAVLLVHHLRKPQVGKKRRPEIADIRGSSVITDQANTIALLAEDTDEGTFTLTITGNYIQKTTLRLQRVGMVFERRGTNESMTASEAIEALAEAGPLTRAEAVKLLQRRGISRPQAYRRVADLEQAGWLSTNHDRKLTLNERLFEAGPGVRVGVSTPRDAL